LILRLSRAYEILGACEIGNFDKDKRLKYDSDMYDEKRRNGELMAAKEDGYAEGRAEGRAEGVAEAQIEIARKFKVLGTDIETIAQATGLDVEVIEGL